MNAPILWDDFRVGASLGEITQIYDGSLSMGWQRIFGEADSGDPAQGAGIAVAMMMRAYLRVVTPRPPGNVHARQRFTLFSLPQLGETVRSVVRCVSKEMRRERRYVELDVRGTGNDGRDVYAGTVTIVWAA